jgi:hypothetical protein
MPWFYLVSTSGSRYGWPDRVDVSAIGHDRMARPYHAGQPNPTCAARMLVGFIEADFSFAPICMANEPLDA